MKLVRRNIKLNLLLVTLAVISLLFVISPATAANKDKPIVLKVTSFLPPPNVSLGSALLKWWEDEVSKRTNNFITFENFWSGALASGAGHLEIVQDGSVQVAHTYHWYTTSKFPIADLEYVFPFGPRDYELVVKAMKKLHSEFPQFKQDHDKQNVVLVSDPPGSTYRFMSKSPVKTLADFKGKRVGLVGRYFGRWLPPGASAVVRPGPQRYELMRNGVIDIDLNPFDQQYSFKIHEEAKYCLNIEPLTGTWGCVLMNKDTFNSFPEEIQKIILEVGKESELKAARETIPNFWNKMQKELKKANVKFIDFPSEDIDKWAASLEDIPAEWAAEVEKLGYPGFEIVNRWQEITSEMGFKWARKWGVRK